jgi:hypothetical protein
MVYKAALTSWQNPADLWVVPGMWKYDGDRVWSDPLDDFHSTYTNYSYYSYYSNRYYYVYNFYSYIDGDFASGPTTTTVWPGSSGSYPSPPSTYTTTPSYVHSPHANHALAEDVSTVNGLLDYTQGSNGSPVYVPPILPDFTYYKPEWSLRRTSSRNQFASDYDINGVPAAVWEPTPTPVPAWKNGPYGDGSSSYNGYTVITTNGSGLHTVTNSYNITSYANRRFSTPDGAEVTVSGRLRWVSTQAGYKDFILRWHGPLTIADHSYISTQQGTTTSVTYPPNFPTFTTANGGSIAAPSTIRATANQWVDFEWTFTPPTNAGSIVLGQYVSVGDSWQFDNVELTTNPDAPVAVLSSRKHGVKFGNFTGYWSAELQHNQPFNIQLGHPGWGGCPQDFFPAMQEYRSAGLLQRSFGFRDGTSYGHYRTIDPTDSRRKYSNAVFYSPYSWVGATYDTHYDPRRVNSPISAGFSFSQNGGNASLYSDMNCWASTSQGVFTSDWSDLTDTRSFEILWPGDLIPSLQKPPAAADIRARTYPYSSVQNRNFTWIQPRHDVRTSPYSTWWWQNLLFEEEENEILDVKIQIEVLGYSYNTSDNGNGHPDPGFDIYMYDPDPDYPPQWAPESRGVSSCVEPPEQRYHPCAWSNWSGGLTNHPELVFEQGTKIANVKANMVANGTPTSMNWSGYAGSWDHYTITQAGLGIPNGTSTPMYGATVTGLGLENRASMRVGFHVVSKHFTGASQPAFIPTNWQPYQPGYPCNWNHSITIAFTPLIKVRTPRFKYNKVYAESTGGTAHVDVDADMPTTLRGNTVRTTFRTPD